MKIIGICYPGAIVPVNGPSCNTTIWKGVGITWMLDIIQVMNMSLADVEIVTELSPSNVTHPLIQTLMDGKADVLPAHAGVSHKRYQFVDFSAPLGYTSSVLYSKKQTNELPGNFLSSTFDLTSYILILITMATVGLAVWVSQARPQQDHPWGMYAFYTIGSFFTGSLPDAMTYGISGRQKLVLALYGASILIVSKSFSGMITASLLSQQVPKQIDSLWDVAKVPSLKIITAERTFWYDDLMSHPATALMEDRIQIRPLLKANTSDIIGALEDISAGTHVLVGHGYTLKRMTEVSDDHFNDQFHKSQPLMSRTTAIALPKGKSTTIRKVSLGFSWLIAFGLINDVPVEEEFVEHHPGECRTLGTSCITKTKKEKSADIARKSHLQALRARKDKKKVTLALKHLQTTLLALIIGLGLSVFAFVAEVLLFQLV